MKLVREPSCNSTRTSFASGDGPKSAKQPSERRLELPADALKSVDALVTKSDGPHFLLTTVHFVLSVKPAQCREGKLGSQTPIHLWLSGTSREGAEGRRANTPRLAIDEKDMPFSPRVWRSIRNGTVQF